MAKKTSRKTLPEVLEQMAPPERPDRSFEAPRGWEPGIKWSNETGTGEAVSEPMGVAPDSDLWKRIISDFGLSPDELEIVDGSLSLIGWKSPVKGASPNDPIESQTINLTRYKVRLRRKGSIDHAERADIEALSKVAMKKKAKPEAKPSVDVNRAMVVLLSDWQVGKAMEEGGGSAETVERINDSFGRVVQQLKNLKKIGRGTDLVYLVGMGDLVEMVCGNYPSQQFTTDLNVREQTRVVRRLVFSFVDELVMLGYRIVLTGVAGNHGEHREGGKAITDYTDNLDVGILEQVGDIISANPERYANVSVVLPTDLAMTLDVAGVPVGFFHGHVTKGGAHPVMKMANWWSGQVMGERTTVKDARILITAHYHHLLVSETTGRIHIQCPAMDPGSHWWSTLTGQSSPAGMLTLMVGTDCGPRGFDSLEVL